MSDQQSQFENNGNKFERKSVAIKRQSAFIRKNPFSGSGSNILSNSKRPNFSIDQSEEVLTVQELTQIKKKENEQTKQQIIDIAFVKMETKIQ